MLETFRLITLSDMLGSPLRQPRTKYTAQAYILHTQLAGVPCIFSHILDRYSVNLTVTSIDPEFTFGKLHLCDILDRKR